MYGKNQLLSLKFYGFKICILLFFHFYDPFFVDFGQFSIFLHSFTSMIHTRGVGASEYVSANKRAE